MTAKSSDQPPPIARADRRAVWSLVIADYRREVATGSAFVVDPIDAHVLADMAERDRVGRERYGVPLTADNGRDHLVDAYQEGLDQAVYLRAWLEEHPLAPPARFRPIRRLYGDQLRALFALRSLIDEIARWDAVQAKAKAETGEVAP